ITYTLPSDDGGTNYVLATDGSGVLSWQSVSGVGAGTIQAVGNVVTGSAFTGSDSSPNKGNDLIFEGSTSVDDANDITITAVNPAASLTYTLPDLGTDGTFAFLEGTQTFSGSKIFNDLTIADTSITLNGGDTALDVTGAGTRTLSLLNSTATQVTNLDLSDGSLLTGGTSRLTNTGALENITGYSQISGNFSLSGNSVFSQTFSSSTDAAYGQQLTITNANTSTTPTTISGTTVNLANAPNTNNTNTLNGISFAAATNNNSNTVNGINFASATGFTNYLQTPTIDISSAGGILGITDYNQPSGNFAISGPGTFSTGTGTVSLNGNTTVTGTNTFTVGTGLTS
ncbi:MAG: hypothetical protein ACRD4B_08810, partial [Acidobacteriota bacterium]